jgi:ADP-ribose pyrophosphatase YjhB (NUDIX family)
MTPHYCFQCGNVLEVRSLDNREREVCPVCGWIYYAQLKVGAAVIMEKDNKLLLLQRNHEPWRGSWMLPAGYVEADEDPMAAAKREVSEETNLVIDDIEFVTAYYFSDDPRGNGVVFVYKAGSVSGEMRLNDESSAAQYFTWEDMPTRLAKGGHDQIVAEWISEARQKDRR